MAYSWPAQSPEANHSVLASGPGSGSTMAHAQQLSAQAAGLQALTSASQANAAGIYGSAWSGAGATGSQAAHTGVNTALAALAVWLEERAAIVTGAAQAYHSAVSAMVPARQAQANRMQEAADVEANPRVLGALSPQIAELNLDYFGHMWPRNASAGSSYGAALNTATTALATPPPPATPAASPAAPAAAGRGGHRRRGPHGGRGGDAPGPPGRTGRLGGNPVRLDHQPGHGAAPEPATGTITDEDRRATPGTGITADRHVSATAV
ncbi:PPE domain-containing protein [Mycolicibacter kumamotonensis]|uniref:PPE domain-containing protein n=1 Tax=Mycolicibacter kumamotonensis TaxID=354243 RepID=A0A1X0DZ99_9MYCO|nr:PPE domain-containing protein [Mycolicibacter kumamotonensis]ORA77508.1 hypothetical protein BST28_17905 [Mycolicibacter kumamotonensis]